jgi:hypothetical protein
MLLDLRFDQRAVVRLQLSESAFVVGAHQATVAHDVGCKNGADPPFGTLALQGSLPSRRHALMRTLHPHHLQDKALDGVKRRLASFPRQTAFCTTNDGSIVARVALFAPPQVRAPARPSPNSVALAGPRPPWRWQRPQASILMRGVRLGEATRSKRRQGGGVGLELNGSESATRQIFPE